MDNISHSLFGAALAETICFLKPKVTAQPQTLNRKRVYAISLIANNFPDLDFLYARFSHAHRGLGYLLHHRGHTHTLAMLLPLAFLILAGMVAWDAKKKTLKSVKEYFFYLCLAVVGGLSHIFLDSLNSYGVHPFWPVFSNWFYGDSLFIVEPWLWVIFSIFLYFSIERPLYRAVPIGIILLALGLSLGMGAVPLLMILALAGWAIVGSLITHWISGFGRVVMVWVGFAVIVVSFGLVSARLDSRVRASMQEESPGIVLEDVILSPLPANPFCWSLITVETLRTKQNYRIRRGLIAPWVGWMSVEDCQRHSRGRFSKGTLVSPSLLWERDWSGSTQELVDFKTKYCDVAEFLKFSRAPFFWKEGERVIFSDMRYDYSDRASFSRVLISDATPPCPDTHAPWVPPRQALWD